MKTRGGYRRKELIEYNYLLMLMNLWPGNWENQLERTKIRVYKDNGRATGTGKGRIRKVWWFSRNKRWKSIVSII